jgi:tetratricopeptide (TPR) repeat protein
MVRSADTLDQLFALAACGLLAVAAGCSLLSPPERSASPVAPAAAAPATAEYSAPPPVPRGTPLAPAEPLPPNSAASPRPAELSPAAHALLSQAQAQQADGDALGAASTLERAVRIEPRNPTLWTELARLRLATGEAPQAESLARKAVALSSGNPRAASEAWRVVADSLKAQRRNAEAREAEARADAAG